MRWMPGSAAQTIMAILITAAFALFVEWLCLLEGRFIRVADLATHYSWAVAFIDGLNAGNLYPRWSSGSYFGLGEPSFYYYAPLTHGICAALNLVVGDAWLSLRITAFLANWAAGLIVLGFMPGASASHRLAGALAVQSSPMFFLVLSFNGAFAWAVSLPFQIGVLLLYAQRRPGEGVSPALAAFYAAICLTHILSGFMMAVTLAAAEACWLVRHPTLARLCSSLGTGMSLLLGMALAGAYLVPALLTLRYASPEAMTTGLVFDWRTSFAFASVTALLYGVRWKLYQYFIASIVALPLVIGALRWQRDAAKDWVEARLLVAGAAAMFFASELSAPLWFIAPQLHVIQFSYRFLAPASAAGLLACAWRLAHSTHRERVEWMVIAVTIFSLLGMQAKLAKEGQNIHFQGSTEWQFYGDANMLPAVHGPDWKSYGMDGGLVGECTRLQLQCDVLRNQPQDRLWRITGPVSLTESAHVRLPAFAYPAWVVVVNGASQERLADSATGAIIATLTAPNSLVELQWVPLLEERIGWTISGAAAILLSGLAAKGRKSGVSRPDETAERKQKVMALGITQTAPSQDKGERL